MPRIVSIQIVRKLVPLKQPYVLSFVTLDAFDTLLAYVVLDNDETRIGEVVPLPGYSTESIEDVQYTLEEWLPNLSGEEVQTARRMIASQITSAPCASSLLLSAIDLDFDREKKNKKEEHYVPLVYPTSSSEPHLERTISNAIATGYRTIKVKVGHSLEQDLAALSRLQTVLPLGIKVRFDANQGYTYEEAKCFLTAVEALMTDKTELFEQPFPPSAWQEMEKLSQVTKIPLMLDESIHSKNDVTRATKIGAQWIKLKLCKQGGVYELVDMAKYARSLGLKVVLGNGVATDISNFIELLTYKDNPRLFSGASESNGFAKLKKPLMYSWLRISSGKAVWK